PGGPAVRAGSARPAQPRLGHRLEEVSVRAGTHLDSLTIAEARARYAGVVILALKKPGSEGLSEPRPAGAPGARGPDRRPGPGRDPQPHGGLSPRRHRSGEYGRKDSPSSTQLRSHRVGDLVFSRFVVSGWPSTSGRIADSE